MGNPTELANKARTTLAQALQALQQPGCPQELMSIAEPIASTMGILHRIEKSGEAEPEECTQALDHVRTALDQLQTAPAGAAVDQAMEAVAGSLSKLFALAKAVRPSSPPKAPIEALVTEPDPPRSKPPRPGPRSAAPQVDLPAKTIAIPDASPSSDDLADLRATLPIDNKVEPVKVPIADQPVPMGTVPLQPSPLHQPAPTAGFPAPQPQAQAPQAQVFEAPAADPGLARVPGMTDAPVPPSTANFVEVELGAHSGSNFYKGLSGNDVIDHGGVFVATYSVPKVGDPIALRVHLPGDLQFDGDAIVQWTRETRSGESDPGFGARFTRISDEGRQLVYRYVKNREPIFYDDL